jgi:hypothetical protein
VSLREVWQRRPPAIASLSGHDRTAAADLLRRISLCHQLALKHAYAGIRAATVRVLGPYGTW